MLFKKKPPCTLMLCERLKDKNIRDVLEFIYQLKANSTFTKLLETSTENAKIKSEWEDEYMYFQDILEDGINL